MSIVEEFGNENFIICGDFNLVLCPELDYCNYLHVNNPKSREKVLELIEERSLIDPYRQLYPDSFRVKLPQAFTFIEGIKHKA
jgi:exonuclease III